MSTTETDIARRDLTQAISEAEREAREAIRVVNARIQCWDDEAHACVQAMRLVAEMAGCLRRLVPHADIPAIHRAFGAPGDFGYETPIGDALARLYRSHKMLDAAPEEDERARIVAWLREHGWDGRYAAPHETDAGGMVNVTSPGKLADAIEQGAHRPAAR
jgi:hypothetical protein